jgi:hypothetical protein
MPRTPFSLPASAPCFVLPELSPSQQLALFRLRRCALSALVVAAFGRSSLRAGFEDDQQLIEQRLAARGSDGILRITPLGSVRCSILLPAAARKLKIKAPMYRRGGYQRRICVLGSTW